MIELTHEPIDYAALTESVRSPRSGAVVLFLGTVREMTEGRRTVALDYDAYPEMAQAKMAELEAEARDRWPIDGVAISHRLGHLELGEISVAVAVSCPHRRQAFEAGRFLIDRLKENGNDVEAAFVDGAGFVQHRTIGMRHPIDIFHIGSAGGCGRGAQDPQAGRSGSNEEMAVGMLDLVVYSTLIRSIGADEGAVTSSGEQDQSLKARRNRVAQDAFAWSYPLIRLADGASDQLWPRLANMYPAYQAVWDNLAADSSGPATVAKAVMDYLSFFRQAKMSLLTAPRPVETELSDDRARPYIIRGLRTVPPGYVQDILDNRPLSASIPSSIAGVVVIADQ
jgi:molybdopterin synthase catalytic subunit